MKERRAIWEGNRAVWWDRRPPGLSCTAVFISVAMARVMIGWLINHPIEDPLDNIRELEHTSLRSLSSWDSVVCDGVCLFTCRYPNPHCSWLGLDSWLHYWKLTHLGIREGNLGVHHNYVRTQAHVQLIVAGIYWCVGGEKSWGYLLPPSVVPPELFISQWDGHMEFFFEFFSHPWGIP